MNFSDEQNVVIEHAGRRLLVLAGPGAGKTATMIERGRHFLRTRQISTPRELLYLTFTNKAANEMAERFSSEPHLRPTVGTFHSFAYHTLLRFGEVIGLRLPFSVIDEESQADIVESIATDYAWKGSRAALKKWVAWINDQCRERTRPKALKKMAEKDASLLLGEYNRRVRESGLMGYGGLLVALSSLLNDPVTAARLRMEFKAVFVDELQDSDADQIDLVDRLCSGESWLTCVADHEQAIYSWRGANPEILLGHEVTIRDDSPPVRFFRDDDGWKTLHMTTNFRSGHIIVQASRRLIAHNKMRSGLDLTAHNEGGEIEILKWPNDRFDSMLVSHIESMDPDSSVGILCRINRDATSISETLRHAGKKVYLAGEQGAIWSTFAGRSYKVALRYALNHHDVWARAFLADNLSPERMAELQEVTGDDPSTLILLLDIVLGSPDYEDAARVTHEVRKFVEAGLSASEALYTATLDPEATEEIPENHIWVSTLHKAKGREFDNVILVKCAKSFWPAKWVKEESADEERRTFYVGMTRARHHLTMLVPDDRDPSRFIGEALPGVVPLDLTQPEIPEGLFDGNPEQT